MKSIEDFARGLAVGVVVLAVGGLAAFAASGHPRNWTRSGVAAALVVFASWAVFLSFVSLFWFLNPHETGGQFVPWLSLVSLLAGLTGLCSAFASPLGNNGGPRREAVRGSPHACPRPFRTPGAAHERSLKKVVRAALALGALATLLVAWGCMIRQTHRFSRPLGRTARAVHFSEDCWQTVEFLRTQTPLTARVLSPFGWLGTSPHGMHAISGWAGRRAVDEHVYLARFYADLSARVEERQRLINHFYEDPSAPLLRRMADSWQVDYLVLHSCDVQRIPAALAHPVFRSAEWSVLEVADRANRITPR